MIMNNEELLTAEELSTIVEHCKTALEYTMQRISDNEKETKVVSQFLLGYLQRHVPHMFFSEKSILTLVEGLIEIPEYLAAVLTLNDTFSFHISVIPNVHERLINHILVSVSKTHNQTSVSLLGDTYQSLLSIDSNKLIDLKQVLAGNFWLVTMYVFLITMGGHKNDETIQRTGSQ